MRAFACPLLASLLALSPIAGCAASQAPITPVAHVDLQRYMGDWYVIASIPSRFERRACNALESYALRSDGRIQTTFSYREDTPDGKPKTMHATGSVQDDSGNAVWGMQFIWPIKAEYIIAWLDADYRTVIVARNKRDYVWIMARTPTISDAQYAALTQRVAALGYDTSKLRRVPQQWPATATPAAPR
jgi:apolipoprotein D and lipocalin family protein